MSDQPRLTIVPLFQNEAKAYVERHHRHRYIPPTGALFQLGVADEAGEIRGVALVGRPLSKALQDGWTAEVLRVATDGCPNACSALYAASWRAARALGWRKLITYTLTSEPGTSLVAANWRVVGKVSARSWDTPSRPRVDLYPLQEKLRWEATA